MGKTILIPKKYITLCAWCGKPYDNSGFIYNGEYICLKCNIGRLRDKRARKEMQRELQ